MFNTTLPMFNAGSALNVVPDKSTLCGTLRSLEEGFAMNFKK